MPCELMENAFFTLTRGSHRVRSATITTPTILAIDLGQCNGFFCWFDVATKSATFRTLPTNEEHFRQALLRQPGVTVVIEACSPEGWVSDLCHELAIPIIVASATGPAWAWNHVPRKTDRDDALKLARLAIVGELIPVTIPPKPVQQRKSPRCEDSRRTVW